MGAIAGGGAKASQQPFLTRVVPRCYQPVQIGTYRVGLFTGSTLGHCGRRALIAPSIWMTAPSVATPRRANKLRKAMQLSGTASASNKSRFMAKYVCLWLRRPTEF